MVPIALHRAGLTSAAAIKSAEPDRLLAIAIADGDKELRQRMLDAAAQCDEVEQAA